MSKGKESKPHIGIYGRRNKGKSSIINILAGQDIAIVSETPGTTTDPVKKSMEIGGIGPVVLIDTAGIDDTGELGKKRIDKSMEVMKTIDAALLVISDNVFEELEKHIISLFNDYDIPYLIIHNKSDISALSNNTREQIKKECGQEVIEFCAVNHSNLTVNGNQAVGKVMSGLKISNTEEVVQKLKKIIPETAYHSNSLIGDLVSYGEVVLLITPIDIEAPEGRLILPQVQTIRDTLDNDCIAVVVKERELDNFFRRNELRPKLAITDSQLFLKAAASVPSDIRLTSFSILLARQKGDFENYMKGTPKIAELKDGDKVLIFESCTHHVSCDDIGRVKIPRWLNNFTGKKLTYEVVSGLNKIPGDIKDYAIVIQCGGCMLTKKQIINRLKPAVEAGIPVTNYGMAIAYLLGIYQRAIAPFVKLNCDSTEYL
ncbi:MAG: [FeFe] hydrogenase H-cluster maturation GTPase HydF [Bacteroidota bacterium]|nr:[FeFe] hydrogenase H-cluster maturation GTPase HydF [Bacteroidota bacterium]